MALTQIQLAQVLNSTASAVTLWKAQGMPVDDPEAAKAWVAANVRRRKSGKVMAPTSTNPSLGPKARLDRAAEGEIRHYELWKAAANSEEANSRTVAELAGAWRDSRKAVAQAEQELGQFLSMTKATLNKAETVAAIRGLISAMVQDFSTFPWGEQATSMLRKHLATLPPSLSEATAKG
jgi:putative salt-induced outer membrane protein YdiY